MRLSSIVTLVCAVGALILTCLCLFAGNKRGFLQNGDLLTLNMSRLGYIGDTFNTSDGDGGFLDNLINDAQGELNDLINSATTDIAEALNISDYYSVHIMNFCQGEFTPNASLAAEGGKVGENTTRCSDSSTGFHFNVTGVVQNALPSGITLEDIHWPEEITDAERTVRIASLAAIILYAIAIGFAGLAVLGAIVGFFTNGRMSACCNLLIDFFGFIAITTASALATVVIIKAVDAVNKYGNDIGVSADRGNTFLGMTWAAAGLMFIAMIVSIAQLVSGRKKTGYISEMKQRRQR